jgi:hypothetical protein
MNTRYLVLAATLIAACAAPADRAADTAADNPAATDSAQQPRPEDTEVWEPEPRIVTPGVGTAAPSDAIVLFDGTDLSAWSKADGTDAGWKVADGAMTVVAGSGDIQTRQPFGSVQLHVEWRTPATVSGDGQGRGNSGVYLMSKYELQVLDSYDNRTYSNGQAGSIYKQYAPLVNASRPPGQWQTYDVIFDAPRFAADSTLVRPAYMTVLQNGVLIQDHVELEGPTLYIGTPAWQAHAPELPLLLQDHGNPVSYRNIWIRMLDDDASG